MGCRSTVSPTFVNCSYSSRAAAKAARNDNQCGLRLDVRHGRFKVRSFPKQIAAPDCSRTLGLLFPEPSLRHVLSHYARHYHEERNHQGKDNIILFPATADRIDRSSGKIQTRERLGGLLKFHHREAA